MLYGLRWRQSRGPSWLHNGGTGLPRTATGFCRRLPINYWMVCDHNDSRVNSWSQRKVAALSRATTRMVSAAAAATNERKLIRREVRPLQSLDDAPADTEAASLATPSGVFAIDGVGCCCCWIKLSALRLLLQKNTVFKVHLIFFIYIAMTMPRNYLMYVVQLTLQYVSNVFYMLLAEQINEWNEWINNNNNARFHDCVSPQKYVWIVGLLNHIKSYR